MKRQVRFLRCACPFCLFSHAEPAEHFIEQLFLHLIARDFRQCHLRLLHLCFLCLLALLLVYADGITQAVSALLQVRQGIFQTRKLFT